MHVEKASLVQSHQQRKGSAGNDERSSREGYAPMSNYVDFEYNLHTFFGICPGIRLVMVAMMLVVSVR
jgi:hypothetical protein